MVEIFISDMVKNKIPGLKLGLVEATGVNVQKEEPRFDALFRELSASISERFSNQPLSSNEIIGHVRRLYRRVGWEPTKYRPSSEALARRILQKKGWYRINNVVDLGNLVSAKFHLPMGLYDMDKLHGNIWVDVGHSGEFYEGISRKKIHAEGKLILRDEAGIFGNPTADSKRTSIGEHSKHLLAVFFTPPEVPLDYLQRTLETLTDYYSPLSEKIEQHIAEFKEQ